MRQLHSVYEPNTNLIYFGSDIVWAGFSNTALAPVVSFAIFTIRAEINGTETLTTEKAVTCLALFALVTASMTILVDALAGMATAIGSLARINEFLAQESRVDGREITPSMTDVDNEKSLKASITIHASEAKEECESGLSAFAFSFFGLCQSSK